MEDTNGPFAIPEALLDRHACRTGQQICFLVVLKHADRVDGSGSGVSHAEWSNDGGPVGLQGLAREGFTIGSVADQLGRLQTMSLLLGDCLNHVAAIMAVTRQGRDVGDEAALDSFGDVGLVPLEFLAG